MEYFENKHIGVSETDMTAMLKEAGFSDLDELIYNAIPDNIRMQGELNLPKPMSEYDYLKYISTLAEKNKIYRSFIGQGYYGTFLPPAIQRNILENPGWYTSYTPYQAEISQGRLEALLNFQTMVADLTALPIANSSLLDEGTAAAEAMWMMYETANKKRKKNPAKILFADKNIFTQTKEVLETRAGAKGIEIEY
ncbi:MAG TPA: glycine dehydrogenase (aminomethyl-transferring), partial [Bacteroidetes bacterium]|nr:glycine dehydrogenase (aminomethyl-transferring) [Bacteroidota bacterium]